MQTYEKTLVTTFKFEHISNIIAFKGRGSVAPPNTINLGPTYTGLSDYNTMDLKVY
jgi:hypothetical protein